jgi:hypothetical protein
MDPERTVLSPFCGRLRSKKAAFLAAPPQTASDILDGSNHCWCDRTKLAVGPDSDVVSPEDCRRDRECYVPWGSPRT